nr:hypothetical protein [Tanacetum cinerariifolium]
MTHWFWLSGHALIITTVVDNNKSWNGAKRPRGGTRNKPLDFIRGLRLSRHPPEQRKDLFLKKFDDVAKAKSLHPTEFEGYTIRERFAKVGCEQLLNFKCDKIYRRVVIQWTASLSRNGDELTGIVDGKSYTITPTIIRDLLKVDTRTDLPYALFNKTDFQTTTGETKLRWVNACKTVFGTYEDAKAINGWYLRSKMTPLAKVLWLIGGSTFYPRAEKMNRIGAHEIYLLYALFTGEYLFSFVHLMIDDIWRAVSRYEYVEVVPPQYRIISRESIPELKFSESPMEYIINDMEKVLRVTFLKKVKPGVAPQPPFENKPPQMRVPDPYMDMTKLQKSRNRKTNRTSRTGNGKTSRKSRTGNRKRSRTPSSRYNLGHRAAILLSRVRAGSATNFLEPR